ncbi:unnamed protein product [Effrenium voratum]|nr:unnamed protein product [Effrenium voratum]
MEPANALLASLHQQRLERQKERRWTNPEEMQLGEVQLRLCSLPSAHLGAQVWASGLALAQHLGGGGGELVRGRRCLELGAGLGLVGLTAAKRGAREVLLTDLDEMQPLLRRNIELNELQTACRARTLVWGTSEEGQWDVVLAADVVYPTKGRILPLLLQSILQLCPEGSSTQLLLAYQPRAEEDQRFLREELLPHFEFSCEALNDKCQLYICRRKDGARALHSLRHVHASCAAQIAGIWPGHPCKWCPDGPSAAYGIG